MTAVVHSCKAALDTLTKITPAAAVLDTFERDPLWGTLKERLEATGVPVVVHSGYPPKPGEPGEHVFKPAKPGAVVSAILRVLPGSGP